MTAPAPPSASSTPARARRSNCSPTAVASGVISASTSLPAMKAEAQPKLDKASPACAMTSPRAHPRRPAIDWSSTEEGR
jgi:hypothetical protein